MDHSPEPIKGGFGEPVSRPVTTDTGAQLIHDDDRPPSRPAPDSTPSPPSAETEAASQGLELLQARSTRWYSYLATADFWLVVAIGQVLALCITATNTFTSLLAAARFNAPAFQTLFNYAFLACFYNALVLARDGPAGNYFTVLAYQYTNLLSAQLINFWSIVCVVAVSALLLKVRYRWSQGLGILVCCGGMGILLASDHLQGKNSGEFPQMLRGDLFGLLGATLYGTSNVLEEWLVSKAPMHHVLAFIGLFGVVINGVQAAIFDRTSIAAAAWSPSMAGWLVGYTLCLSLFYSLAPLILRMGSAAFFDISLLTANFWGVIIGVHVFGYSVHYLYPVAFVCIVIGLVVYFLSGSVLGDSRKPWLGANQEAGVAGIGTAKLRAINAARAERGEEPESAGLAGVTAAARSAPSRVALRLRGFFKSE
ncbi:hypothetical protein HIM_04663 [Hirsutella minnesotensis 3608]|uniref:Uncharacterized protein n=1 Tax=Hirsutella minnesotensis 3608 TaxID=1043627 RepID=A0A0F8A5S5_9HYPO|nr:hypothetical protein HIM_04663 [Hirsutella minnesotensis 3608]